MTNMNLGIDDLLNAIDTLLGTTAELMINLFVNDVVLQPGMVVGDFVAPTFNGYVANRPVVTVGAVNSTEPLGDVRTIFPSIAYVPADALSSDVVRGWTIVGHFTGAPDMLLAAQKLDAPWTANNGLNPLVFQPTLVFGQPRGAYGASQ